jgi:hypothetical protein
MEIVFSILWLNLQEKAILAFWRSNRSVSITVGKDSSMDALLTAIVLWLSANSNLPATFEHPAIKFVPPSQMATLRYKTLISPQQRTSIPVNKNLSQLGNMRKVVAIYDNRRKIIYLSNKWTGRTAADISVIVHEMVHHLQYAAGVQYECPSEREKLAYEAQAKWLALFGHSLESEFQIDRLTMLVTTSCALGILEPR